MIRFGNIVQSQISKFHQYFIWRSACSAWILNRRRLPNCAQWSLTEQLDKEKEVTGIYLSGHPFDHYKFEIKHYGITNIQDFNEIKESQYLASKWKNYKLLALVSVANHRISRQGNKFGSFILEDYSAKPKLFCLGMIMFDTTHYFNRDRPFLLRVRFKQRYNKSEFEFKVNCYCLG